IRLADGELRASARRGARPRSPRRGRAAARALRRAGLRRGGVRPRRARRVRPRPPADPSRPRAGDRRPGHPLHVDGVRAVDASGPGARAGGPIVSARAWRPLGFLLLMLGFGVRLDSDWQALAWMLFIAGGCATLLGLRG